MRTNSATAAALSAALASAALALGGSAATAGPGYEQDRRELEAILEDLLAWFPGEWSNAPQLYHERTVRMPAEGEHEPWYRTFARIDAPQIGPYVLYGQINLGGRDGPVYRGSQVLYKISIDEQRGVVLIRGQGPADPEKFVNLQDHPELWRQVRMRNEAGIRCDFIWRRDGEQIVGVLDGPTEERRKGGPGTCSYVNAEGKAFFADAEWTLSPEALWLYDLNTLDGIRFQGRADRTHVRLYRARPYRCSVEDADGRRTVASYDRGGSGAAKAADGRALEWTLLRGRYPGADGVGLDEQLRLTLHEPESLQALDIATAAPAADSIRLNARGIRVDCLREQKFGPMPGGG
jgi:hypothetical protein